MDFNEYYWDNIDDGLQVCGFASAPASSEENKEEEIRSCHTGMRALEDAFIYDI